ncbi:hypothetical protein K3179_08520 [Qipengyuania sp. GH38]|uniref:hypothetical protein n=1 Tax=Qipengyuania intermedia TaxID=2867244 RepID=UPI001C8736E9|nr:hypothetical protein [Qipengyuania intermedia]MBX7514586.1 hypothetical protein [Qipengyuania intermedia]
MTPRAVIRLPQVLGAALSANVFVVIAQAIAVASGLAEYAFLMLIFVWNLKDGIDDFKTYESDYASGFSLAPTVTYRVIAYVLLAVAAISLPDLQTASIWFALYFATLTLWSANSAFRRSRQQRSDENDERLRRRKGWLVLYPICAICALVLGCGLTPFFFGAFLIAALYLFDALECRTFSNEINETL